MDRVRARWPARRGLARRAGTALVACALGGTLLTACALTASALGACTSASVRISLGQFGVGHGHFGGALLFRNSGSTACTLHGYPVARAVSRDARRTVAVRDSDRGYVGGLLPGRTRAPRITLAPGAVASAILEGVGTSGAGRPCPTYRSLLVGVPGGRATTALSIETQACRRLQVHPIVPGASGDESP